VDGPGKTVAAGELFEKRPAKIPWKISRKNLKKSGKIFENSG
jgi:hypothetical protein